MPSDIASAVGGVLGIGADLYSARQNREMQKEFAQQGIRWRVEDAKAAGVHPLYALGSGVTPYSPQATAFAEAGMNVGRAAYQGQTEAERATHLANLKVLESQAEKNHAEALLAGSEIARRGQASREATAFPISASRSPEVNALYADALKLSPDEMVSRSIYDPGSTAGEDHPAMRQFLFPGGLRAVLPATQGGGIPEDIDASLLPFVIGANLEKYGTRWLVDMIGYATGASPDKRRRRGTLEGFMRKRHLLPRTVDDFERAYRGY